jgi:uncharacterized protein YkwD
VKIFVIALICLSTLSFSQNPPAIDSDAEHEIFRLVNLERARAGLSSLRLDPSLEKAARQHSRVMSDARQLSHEFGAEPPFSRRLALAGASFNMSGENVAFNQSAAGAHRGLMNSPPHRANILNPDFNAIGIGVVRDGDNIWVTQDFAREFEKQSEQDARNAVIAAFQRARRKAGAPNVTVVDEPRVQTLACRLSKQGTLDTKAALGTTGARTATVYTEGDLSHLPTTAQKIAADPSIQRVGVGVCFGKSDKYEAGMNWVVLVGY